LHHDFRARFRGTAPALPVTLAAQNRLRPPGNQQPAGNVGTPRLVAPLHQMGNGTALIAVPASQLAQQHAVVSQLHQAAQTRAHAEAARAAVGVPVGGTSPPPSDRVLNSRSFYPGTAEPAHSRPDAAPHGMPPGRGGPSSSAWQDLPTAPPRFSGMPQVIV